MVYISYWLFLYIKNKKTQRDQSPNSFQTPVTHQLSFSCLYCISGKFCAYMCVCVYENVILGNGWNNLKIKIHSQCKLLIMEVLNLDVNVILLD